VIAMTYDYLIVGSGLFGATFAHEATKRNKRCLVVERREHIGGNVYCKEYDGIQVHAYGAHIFHTGDKDVWDYIQQFAEFNHYINSPVANYHGELYNLPFNMNTFHAMWGVATPQQAQEIITQQRAAITSEPSNLQEQAISLVGHDIYEKLIRGYTEKQWGRPCHALPAFIIRRLPVRYTYDNNYFNDPHQGIPVDGYTAIVEKMLADCEVLLHTDYNEDRDKYNRIAKKVIYTGPIDAFFDYRYGQLEYRSLRFETQRLEMENYQGVAVMNFTDEDTPYTRIIEHKHFNFGKQPVTYVTKEYPLEWQEGSEPYYPVNDDKNQRLFERYHSLAKNEERVRFGGRLAEYKYYDMDKTIAGALQLTKEEFDE
jgi:UDP-galactopyranose mutase